MAPKREEQDAASSSPTAGHTSTRSHLLPSVVTLPGLLDSPVVEPDWIVPALLPIGVSLLAGPALVDKPLLANQLGLSVATGVPFLQHVPARQGRVLYLALAESVIHVRGRALSLLNKQKYPDNFHLAFTWSPFRQGGLADLEDTIASLDGTRLVIVDPLEFVQPLRADTGHNNGYRVRQSSPPEAALSFLLPLRELALRYDLAMLLLHHLPDDWPANRRDPLAGLSPTGLTTATACNLLLMPGREPTSTLLQIAGPSVAERRLRLVLDRLGGYPFWEQAPE